MFSLESPLSLSVSASQPLIQCTVGGVSVHALIDTGSMVSFISSRAGADPDRCNRCKCIGHSR